MNSLTHPHFDPKGISTKRPITLVSYQLAQNVGLWLDDHRLLSQVTPDASSWLGYGVRGFDLTTDRKSLMKYSQMIMPLSWPLLRKAGLISFRSGNAFNKAR